MYVFVRANNAWSQEAYVKASNTRADDRFGNSVALSATGDTLVVGSIYEDSAATGIGGDQANDAADGSGAVYVYARANNAWSQQAYIKASNTGANDVFGYDVAVSADGNTVAVGAYGEGSNATGVGGDQVSSAELLEGAQRWARQET